MFLVLLALLSHADDGCGIEELVTLLPLDGATVAPTAPLVAVWDGTVCTDGISGDLSLSRGEQVVLEPEHLGSVPGWTERSTGGLEPGEYALTWRREEGWDPLVHTFTVMDMETSPPEARHPDGIELELWTTRRDRGIVLEGFARVSAMPDGTRWEVTLPDSGRVVAHGIMLQGDPESLEAPGVPWPGQAEVEVCTEVTLIDMNGLRSDPTPVCVTATDRAFACAGCTSTPAVPWLLALPLLGLIRRRRRPSAS